MMDTIKTISEGRSDLYKLPVDKVQVEEGFNVRQDYGDIQELAQSISEVGQRVPVRVRMENGHAILVDGHRRLKAIQYANEHLKTSISTILAINEERGANEETRILDLFLCNNGKPLTVIEEALAVKRLVDFQWKPTDIAKKLGKSPSYISSLLSLNSATHLLRDAVKKGYILPTAAFKLVTAPKEKQEEILKDLSDIQSNPTNNKKHHITVGEVEKATKGAPSVIGTKPIRSAITEVQKLIKEGKNEAMWKAVLYGLQISIGSKKFDPTWTV